MNLSAIQEDYIKIIWNLEQKAEIPRPSSVAEIMNVKCEDTIENVRILCTACHGFKNLLRKHMNENLK